MASSVRRELRTYRLSRSLKIHECAELLSLAKELTMPHGNVNRNNRWNNVNEKHDFVFIIHTYFVFVTICSQ